MTLNDLPAFVAAWDRMARLAGMKPDQQARSDWWDALQRHPLYAVEQALTDCHREAGRYKPTVGLVDELCVKALADREGSVKSTSPTTRYYQDDAGVTQAEYRCWLCCDLGWRAKVRATGELLTEADLQRRGQLARDDPRRLSTADYAMTRCQCRVGVQGAVA